MSIFGDPNVTDYPWPTAGSFGDILYNTNQNSAYQNWLNQYGLAFNQGRVGQFARGLFGQSQDQYESMVPQKGLGYTYTDFLKGAFPHIFESAWTEQTPNQQGLNSATPGIGRTRYVGWPTG